MDEFEKQSDGAAATANCCFEPVEKSRYDFSPDAGAYEPWYQTPRGRMYDRFEKEAIRKHLPPASPGMTLLDVGCGTGHWSRFFTRYGYSVTGLDVSESMIENARNVDSAGIHYLLGDAHNLPFPDNLFDVSTAITTIEFVRDPAGVLREMVRCTKKQGGTVIIGTLNCCARINRKRRNRGISPYAYAWMLSPRQIYHMLQPYGDPDVTTAAFAPGWSWLLSFAPLTNAVGTALRLPTGALTLGVVQL